MSVEEDAARVLAEWMRKMKLDAYVEKAETWRQNVGAVTIDEVKENVDDFAAELKLKPLEIKRIKKDFNLPIDGAGAATPAVASQAGGGYTAAAKASPPPPAPAAYPPPGALGSFGKAPAQYTILEELGSGATATVNRCRKADEPNTDYAVKIISIAKLRLQRDFQKVAKVLNREMQILLSLSHDRIVRLYDVIEETDKLYLVMELVKGGELFDFIVSRGTLGEEIARNIFVQIVEALKYVHSKDIVYRDLKPENILVVNNFSSRDNSVPIKLSDFGHSKLINDGYSTALTRVGTPQYWAPEVSAVGGKAYTQAVDLWSLGVVLYVMLLGSYPFDGVSQPIDMQIKNPQLNFRSPVTGREPSKEAQDLITQLIRVNPKQRRSLDECMEHAWVQSAGTQMASSVHARPAEYLNLMLPSRPSKEQRDQMVTDLLQFQRKFHCFAQVRPDRVVADLSSLAAEKAEFAKADLRGIVKCQLNVEPYEMTSETLTGTSRLPPTSEEGAQYYAPVKLHTTTLRVSPADGAGLDLIAETGGMRVEQVCPRPGQYNVRAGDLIVKINEITLVGAPETVENIFGNNFSDGVQIQVKRES